MITFFLPLGLLGSIGVVGLALLAVLDRKLVAAHGIRPIAAAIPIGVATVAAAALGVDPRSNLVPAIGASLAISIGLLSVRALIRQSQTERLLSTFVLGASLLAVTVVVDFGLGTDRLPSGLFWDPSMHNWAGTIFAMALPAALHLARQRSNVRVVGACGALCVVTGTLASLSWVGLLGATAGACAYFAYAPLRLVTKVSVGVAAGLFTLAVITLLTGLRSGVELRGYDLARLQSVLTERVAINRMALDLALDRPLLGWGAFPSPHSGITDAIDAVESAKASSDGVRPTNLVAASEALDAPAWRARNVQISPNVVLSPINTYSADLVRSDGLPGARVYQYVRRANHRALTYTFSLWLRSASGRSESVALSIATIDEGQSALLTASGSSGESVADRTVPVQVGEDWQRYSVHADFASPPRHGLVVHLFVAGYVNREAPGAPGIYVWGAQLTEGPQEQMYVPNHTRLPVPDLRSLGHFHSYYAQTAFESGFLGLASLVVFLGAIGRSAGRSSRRDVALAALLAFMTTQALDLAAPQVSILLSFFLLSSIGTTGISPSSSPSVRSSIERQTAP